jgi:Coenzyme F390 synthetase
MVTPSYMLAILDEMERQGDDPAASSLRFGIFGAEPWTNRCAPRWRPGPGSTPPTSTACPR